MIDRYENQIRELGEKNLEEIRRLKEDFERQLEALRQKLEEEKKVMATGY